MSYDLMVYAPTQQRVSRSAVAANMRSMGWNIVFFSDYFDMVPAESDTLDAEYELPIGWLADTELSSQIQHIITTRDMAALDRLYETMQVGSCELSSGNVDEEDSELYIPENLHPDKLSLIKSVKTSYYLRSAGGRSPMSAKFQEALWRAIGQASGGLLEDPQTGVYSFSSEIAAQDVRSQMYSEIDIKPPMAVIEWYVAFAVLGALVLILNRPAVLANSWYTIFMILHAPLAYGLFKGVRWVWFICIGLSALMIAIGTLSLVFIGFNPIKLMVTAMYAYILWQLLTVETRYYFA